MMRINRLGSQIGAEILGVDVRNLDDETFGVIYQTWLDNNVIAVRDQELEIDDFLRYSRRFGHIAPHPSKSTRHPDHPELTVMGINKFDADGNLIKAIYGRGSENWHTDGAYDEQPFKATQLYALAIPSVGGDTLFASMYAAYEALPDRLKHKLEGRDKYETLVREIMVEGILSIQSGDNPRILEEKLLSFLPPSRRDAVRQESARE